jgi:hypothetical protein
MPLSINPKTFKTLEFYLIVLAAIGPWLANAAMDSVDAQEALTWNVLAAAAYALSRGFAKINTDVKDFWHTSEFWIAVIGSAAAGIGVLNDTLGGTRWAQLQGLLLAAASIANGMRKDPMVATGAVPVVAITGMDDPIDLPDVPNADGDDKAANAGDDPFKDS